MLYHRHPAKRNTGDAIWSESLHLFGMRVMDELWITHTLFYFIFFVLFKLLSKSNFFWSKTFKLTLFHTILIWTKQLNFKISEALMVHWGDFFFIIFFFTNYEGVNGYYRRLVTHAVPSFFPLQGTWVSRIWIFSSSKLWIRVVHAASAGVSQHRGPNKNTAVSRSKHVWTQRRTGTQL